MAAALEATGKFDIAAADIQTNILWIPCRPGCEPAAWAAQFKERGILVGAYGGNMIRMCTHLGVTNADTNRVVDAIQALAG